MEFKDVTEKVEFEMPQDGALVITKCVCGNTFSIYGKHIYTDVPIECSACGRKYVWEVRVNEVID